MLLAISFSAIYFIGLGLLFCPKIDEEKDLFSWLGLLLTLGILSNYGALLLLQKNFLTFGVCVSLSALGWVRFFIREGKGGKFTPRPKTTYFLLAYLFLIFFFAVFNNSILNGSDAHLIWFFHSKMIWANNAFDRSAGWNDPLIQWSHMDYPKLIPVMGAQMAWLMGFWNGYIPKGAIFFSILPSVFWILSFFRFRFSFLFLLLIPFFFLSRCLVSGYLDGVFALYAGVASILLVRYGVRRNPLDLYSVICILGLILNLKNEGTLFLVSFAMGTWVVTRGVKIFVPNKRLLFICLFSVFPSVIWGLYKFFWGLNVDLLGGSPLLRLMTRVRDASSVEMIYRSLFYNEVKDCFFIFLFLYLATRWVRIQVPKLFFAIPVTAIIYYFGVFGIYLLTHQDLRWHLVSSADRTSLPVLALLFSGVFILLSELEDRGLEKIGEIKRLEAGV